VQKLFIINAHALALHQQEDEKWIMALSLEEGLGAIEG